MDTRPGPKKAVAVKYDPEQAPAPMVVARGRGLLAEKIMEAAQESGVPVREDAELAEYLMALDLYQEIPVHLYEVVAEILAFVYRTDRGARAHGKLPKSP